MFLAISLALPIYSMAQTKLTLEDSTGNRISTPGIKSFAVGTDNNMIIILDQPFNFADLIPDISLNLDSCQSCSITAAAGVRASPGANLSFNVQSTDTSAAISLVAASYEIALPDTLPLTLPTTNGSAPFSWNTGVTPSGSYLAVFQAQVGTGTTSQLPVMITIAQQYKLTLTAGANGTVSPAGVHYYDAGTQVQISATANSGYYFSSWSDGGTGNPRTVTMDQDRTISATFTQNPTYTVSVSVSNPSGGSVTPTSRSGIASGGTASFTVTINSGYTASVSAGSLNGTAWTFTNVTTNINATITFTQSGGGGDGTTIDNPIKLNTPCARNTSYYGYNINYGSEYTIPRGATRYFEVDPIAYTRSTGSTGIIKICVFDYDQSPNVSSTLIVINKNTGAQKATSSFSGAQSYKFIVYTPPNPPDEKYIIQCVENGTKNQAISVWWEFSSSVKGTENF
jgi:hypothetical protein